MFGIIRQPIWNQTVLHFDFKYWSSLHVPKLNTYNVVGLLSEIDKRFNNIEFELLTLLNKLI